MGLTVTLPDTNVSYIQDCVLFTFTGLQGSTVPSQQQGSMFMSWQGSFHVVPQLCGSALELWLELSVHRTQ